MTHFIGRTICAVLLFIGAAVCAPEAFRILGWIPFDALREWKILVSETEKAIASVEADIAKLRKIDQSGGSNTWKFDNQLRRNAETKSKTETEIAAKKAMLGDLDSQLEAGKKLYDKYSGKEMTEEEIDAYIARTGVELRAFQDLLAELNRQDELLTAQVAKIRQETGTVPIRTLELTKGLELLLLQNAFNKQYYTEMQQNGCPVDAETIYRQAKNTLVSTLSDLGCGSPAPMPEPDLGTVSATAERSEQQRQKIADLLGKANTAPIVK